MEKRSDEVITSMSTRAKLLPDNVTPYCLQRRSMRTIRVQGRILTLLKRECRLLPGYVDGATLQCSLCLCIAHVGPSYQLEDARCKMMRW